MMNYRVNYGNGQVSSNMSLSDCRAHVIACRKAALDQHVGSYYIQRRIDGEWAAVKSEITNESAR